MLTIWMDVGSRFFRGFGLFLFLGGGAGSVLALAAPISPKVLHVALGSAETGFDPVMTSDLNTAAVEQQLFESLLTYDYLARPVKLVPRLAATMPVVSNGGRTWRFTLKQGVYFSPDPVFHGQRREATSQDVVYTLMRFMDPRNRSPYKFLLDGRIVGLDERAELARHTGHFDYDSPVAGLEVVDRYTLVIHLKTADFNFGHAMAQPMMGVVAREVIEAYASDTASHPVGTGPYRLGNWVRAARIQLLRNPNYRDERWNFSPSQPADLSLVHQMEGKRIPQIDEIDLQIIEEPQSAWLSFARGELDILGIPAQFAPLALEGEQLRADWRTRGIRLERSVDPAISYYFINQQDPVLGGNQPEKIALRRAIFLAINDDEMIRVMAKGQAIRNAYPIPPGVAGYDPKYRSLLDYNPELANHLLDAYGFRRAPDGYRHLPDGGDLTVHYTTGLSSEDRELDEVMKKSMDRIGIHWMSDKRKFPDIIRAERQCLIQFRLSGWIADYPDGDNFMQLWYGPHIHENNASCYQDVEWDRLYEQSLTMPDSPQRDILYHRLARRLELQGVTKVSTSPLRNVLSQPWVEGFRVHPILPSVWEYLDLTSATTVETTQGER
ncbi:MAG: ABC transporter substrate-binding protein [Betaproteobacteria bacterium]|jgi:ABC-type dipeptide transport system, periplasmic component|nr:ABC transporter substrate-binding protein [Betaproteobacteria bacterium]